MDKRRKFKKVGEMDYSKDGALLLVNERDEAYVVDDATVFVWNIADGKTFEELREKFKEKIGDTYLTLEEELANLLEILLRCKLLKYET